MDLELGIITLKFSIMEWIFYLGCRITFKVWSLMSLKTLQILNALWKAKCYTFFGLSFNYNFHQEFYFWFFVRFPMMKITQILVSPTHYVKKLWNISMKPYSFRTFPIESTVHPISLFFWNSLKFQWQNCSIFNISCILSQNFKQYKTVLLHSYLFIEGFLTISRVQCGHYSVGDFNITKQNKQTNNLP